MIRTVLNSDAPILAEIYNHYVQNTVITFEQEPVSSLEMAKRIQDRQEVKLPWLVVEHQGVVFGYAYATAWRAREAYRHSVESTVYLQKDSCGKGWGSLLLQSLLKELRQKDVHAVMAGIALPNDASCSLHETHGFTKVAHFSQVGRKHQRWVDVGYWQKILLPSSTVKSSNRG